MTQLTTILSQLGQVVSAVPFAALLHGAGWTAAFATTAGGGVLVAVLVAAVVRNAPVAWVPAIASSPRDLVAEVLTVWRRPGTRLGFFGHMATQFSMMVFTLLWGVPYLVSGQGLTAEAAGGLLTLFVVATIGAGPIMGALTARLPMHRSQLLLAVVASQVITWTAVLVQDGPAPHWLLVVLIVVLAVGGPGSVVGIDIARTANPAPNLAVAQSIANLGGFLATLLVLVAMGEVLTALGGFSPEAFRLAWLVQYPVWAGAVVGVLVWRRRTRSADAENGAPQPVREVLAGQPA